MSTKTSGGLRTVTWVVTQDQYDTIVEIRDRRKKSYTRISQSDIVREVIAAGLEVINHGENIASEASDKGRAA